MCGWMRDAWVDEECVGGWKLCWVDESCVG